VEEVVGCNRVVDFGFEDGEEAGFAKFLVILWSEDESAIDSTGGTKRGCHNVLWTSRKVKWEKLWMSGFGDGGDF
jgi:hypothetical protein